MKNSPLSAVMCLLLLLVIGNQAYSQENLLKWSPLKLVPSPVPLLAFHFGYEHILGENRSVGVTVKYYLPMNLQGFDVLFEENQDRMANGVFLSGSVNGYSIGPEFRFYKKGTPNGFYLMPFLRFFVNSGSGVMQYAPQNAVENSFIDGQFSFGGAGGGLAIGTQYVWDNGFLIDANVGVGLTVSSISMRGTLTGPLASEMEAFTEDLSDAVSTIPLISTRFTNNGTQLNARSSGILTPNLKSQLAIGYAF